MFKDIFGVVLWKGLVEDKLPDMGEMQATRKGNFLMKCRLLRILNFFTNVVFYNFWEHMRNIEMQIYIIYRVSKQKFAVLVLGTEATILIKFSQSW